MHFARENTWPPSSSRSTSNAKFGPVNSALHGSAQARTHVPDRTGLRGMGSLWSVAAGKISSECGQRRGNRYPVLHDPAVQRVDELGALRNDFFSQIRSDCRQRSRARRRPIRAPIHQRRGASPKDAPEIAQAQSRAQRTVLPLRFSCRASVPDAAPRRTPRCNSGTLH